MNPNKQSDEQAMSIAWKSMSIEQRMDHLDEVLFNAKLDREARSGMNQMVIKREREQAAEAKRRDAELSKRERLLATRELLLETRTLLLAEREKKSGLIVDPGQPAGSAIGFSRSELIEISDAISSVLDLALCKGDPDGHEKRYGTLTLLHEAQAKILPVAFSFTINNTVWGPARSQQIADLRVAQGLPAAPTNSERAGWQR